MNEKNTSLAAKDRLDSQRLKEAFFPPKQQAQPEPPRINKKPKNKNIIGIIAVILICAGACAWFISEYDLMLVPRKNLIAPKNSFSLLSDKNTAIKLETENGDYATGREATVFSLPVTEKTAVTLTFAYPVNLRANHIIISLQRTSMPFKIGVTARDEHFFSNAANPVIVEVTPEGSLADIPVSFYGAKMGNTYINRVKNITLYFYPVEQKEKNIIIINDILLVKNPAGN